ncbi:choline transporter-like protein 2 [Babylonia areolata]|uniref:choline transporter-like protein 2 n=1 Tax=Babylonia areolata TaxID=304850 RepID=UPI003FD08C65
MSETEYRYATRLQLFVLFMLFWTTNFVEALDQIVVAGAFSIHFWTMDKKSRSFQMVIFQSFYRTVRYHLGSLAFGSLVVAIVQMIRFLLEYVDRKIRMAENKVAKFLIKCLKWCMMCLESFIKFLNKNAYIMIAMFGKNFFISAKNAYMLIMRNVTQTVVVDKVVTFINVIAKLAITGAAGAAAYYVFEERVTIPYLEVQAPELNFSLLPIIVGQ